MKAINVRLLEIEQMNRLEYNQFRGWQLPSDENGQDEGFKVVDTTGHVSWLPKKQFDKSCLIVDDNPNLPSGVSIGPNMVDEFIESYKVIELDGKTTIVHAYLKNGFTMTEASSCVDPKNYNREIGIECCLERIKNNIWNRLGFLLQSGFVGFDYKHEEKK